AYLESNEPNKASYYSKKSLKLFKEASIMGDTLIWYTSALKLKSDIELAHNNSNEALRIISDAIMLTDASFANSKNRERAKYYLARGQLLIKSKQEAAAITDFNQSLTLLKKDSSSNYVSDYTYTH